MRTERSTPVLQHVHCDRASADVENDTRLRDLFELNSGTDGVAFDEALAIQRDSAQCRIVGVDVRRKCKLSGRWFRVRRMRGVLDVGRRRRLHHRGCDRWCRGIGSYDRWCRGYGSRDRCWSRFRRRCDRCGLPLRIRLCRSVDPGGDQRRVDDQRTQQRPNRRVRFEQPCVRYRQQRGQTAAVAFGFRLFQCVENVRHRQRSLRRRGMSSGNAALIAIHVNGPATPSGTISLSRWNRINAACMRVVETIRFGGAKVDLQDAREMLAQPRHRRACITDLQTCPGNLAASARARRSCRTSGCPTHPPWPRRIRRRVSS